METKTTDHSLIHLIQELRDETTTLMRQEVALAKAELSEKCSRLTRDSIYIGIGGGLAFAALIFLLLAARELIFVGLIKAELDSSVAIWLSPLCVAIVIGLIGWGLIVKGKKLFSKEGLAPRKTVESLRENQYWLKHKLART